MDKMIENLYIMVMGTIIVYVFMTGKPSIGLVWFTVIVSGLYLGVSQWLKRRKKKEF